MLWNCMSFCKGLISVCLESPLLSFRLIDFLYFVFEKSIFRSMFHSQELVPEELEAVITAT